MRQHQVDPVYLSVWTTLVVGPPRANSNEGLLSLIAHLTHLTHLDLAHSLTAAWRHQAVPLDSHDLQHLAGLTALQVMFVVCLLYCQL